VNAALAALIDMLAAVVLDSLEAEAEAPPPEDPLSTVPAVGNSGDPTSDRDNTHSGSPRLRGQ
jgi:hypothetical protein